MAEQEDYYTLLGIEPGASQAEVTAAYAAKVAAHAADPQQVLTLTHAFQTLSTPEGRAEYDRSREPAAPASPAQMPTVLPGAFPVEPAAPPSSGKPIAPNSPVSLLTKGEPGGVVVDPAASGDAAGDQGTVRTSGNSPITEDSPTITSSPAQSPGAQSPGPDRTVLVTSRSAAPSMPAGEVTQRPSNIVCPVCGATNAMGFGIPTSYCVDCGFLLGQTPGEGPAAAGTGVRLLSADGSQEYWLREGANTVGRQDADVLLSDNTVSRLHAHLYLSGNQLAVEDGNSTNGSRLNGIRLDPGKRTSVADGAELQFGGIVLQVHGAGSAPAVAARTPGILENAGQDTEVELARLVALTGSHVYPIYSFPASVGRRADSSIVINDPYISGRHAEILQEEGGIFIRDLGSTNGTMIAGEPVGAGSPVALPPGKWVQFGKQRFQVELTNTAASVLPETDASAAGMETPLEPVTVGETSAAGAPVSPSEPSILPLTTGVEGVGSTVMSAGEEPNRLEIAGAASPRLETSD